MLAYVVYDKGGAHVHGAVKGYVDGFRETGPQTSFSFATSCS